MSSQRLFVALPIPAHVRALVAAAAAPARDAAPELTWTRPEGWHVTLAFLGEVAGGAVAAVEDRLAAAVAGSAPIVCHLGDPGRFDRRALWLAVEDRPAGAIAELGAQVQRALGDAELPVAPRPVRAHLTLARAPRAGANVDDEVVAAVAPVSVEWEAAEVELVRSHLGDGPARYEAVARWPLTAR